jgi:hypothetical protein
VDLHEVVLARTSPQLAHSLDKGHALNVTNSTTQFNYADVGLLAGVIDGNARDPLDPFLNGIRDMGDDLYGFTQIVALAFALNDVLVNLASGDIVIAC